MNKKKLLWIVILLIFIIGIIIVVSSLKPKNSTSGPQLGKSNAKVTDNSSENNNTTEDDNQEKYIKKELTDGILYSLTGEKEEADVVVGDKYFDTTINNMAAYYDDYAGKKIEIEGMYLEDSPYTYVGRYSLAACCAGGFSTLCYELDGTIDESLADQENWIKLVGTLEIGKANFGTEEDPHYFEYCYLKATSIEIMNEFGQKTIYN